MRPVPKPSHYIHPHTFTYIHIHPHTSTYIHIHPYIRVPSNTSVLSHTQLLLLLLLLPIKTRNLTTGMCVFNIPVVYLSVGEFENAHIFKNVLILYFVYLFRHSLHQVSWRYHVYLVLPSSWDKINSVIIWLFSGQPRRITSKIGSLHNANYRPGGGNVGSLNK